MTDQELKLAREKYLREGDVIHDFGLSRSGFEYLRRKWKLKRVYETA